MKIRNGIAENVCLDRVDLLDLSYAVRGIARAQEILLDPDSYPAEEIAAQVAYELAFAGNLIAALNLEVIGQIAGGSAGLVQAEETQGAAR